MDNEKIPIQERKLYPFFFMVFLTAIFVAILGLLFHSSEQKIKDQEVLAYQTQMVNIFADTLSTVIHVNKEELLSPTKVAQAFSTYYKKSTKPLTYYTVEANGMLLGYCFDISGSGLWGTMNGFVGMTPDLNRIVNFTIYQQQETPGLGARVSESWFKKQFHDKILRLNGKVLTYSLVPEEATPATQEIKQITGATITSSSVSKMLFNEMNRIIPLIESQHVNAKSAGLK
ncbi:MAG TPA: FMN-binding protein [Candidatus Cloacimonadota bacterium]|nr:FMN-binding protein [Candidatus Cloacimonadota bacterium]